MAHPRFHFELAESDPVVVAVSELLMPYDARLMRCYPICTRINQVANDDEECSAPVELAQIQNRLFS
jgi:putative SOS response-associated peptidase YedK